MRMNTHVARKTRRQMVPQALEKRAAAAADSCTPLACAQDVLVSLLSFALVLPLGPARRKQDSGESGAASNAQSRKHGSVLRDIAIISKPIYCAMEYYRLQATASHERASAAYNVTVERCARTAQLSHKWRKSVI